MDGVSSAGAVIAVITLAAKTYQSLNTLIHNLSAAPDYLVALRSQSLTFFLALRTLSRCLQADGLPVSQKKEIEKAIRGGAPIIEQLYKHLAPFQVQETRLANGKIKRTAPVWDKIQSQLDEGRIKIWIDAMGRHCETLSLLLKAQELDRIVTPLHTIENTGANASGFDVDVESIMSAEENKNLDEWVDLGNSFEPEAAIKKTEQSEEAKKTSSSSRSFWTKKVIQVQKKVKDSREDLLQHYRRILTQQTQELPCPMFRVVVLGRSGAGKSKLSARVFGLPYLDDGPDGKKTPPEQIWKQINDSNMKRKFALHDSGGLEGKRTTKAVKDYLTHVQQAKELQDQVHAIWYVIPCQDPFRAFHETDEEFLAGELVDTGEIPIFVIFSQYDLLVKRVRSQMGNEASEEAVQKSTYQVFKSNIESRAMAAVKDKSKFHWCRIGLRDDGSEYLAPSDGGPSFGVEQLVKQVESGLENGWLQIQWVAIQQKDDQAKLYDSITTTVALMWTARYVAKSSYLPYICLIGLTGIYSSILNQAGIFWRIDEWKESLDHAILRAVFDLSSPELFIVETSLILNVFGGATVPLISNITLKLIVGVNLIGRRIFRLQALNKKEPLTKAQIEAEIAAFQQSDDRKRMAEVITSQRMAKIDYKRSDRVDKVLEVARQALEAAVGYVDNDFFTKARLDVIKKMGTMGTPE